MKNVLRLLILAAAVASFTLPSLAQDASAPATGAASVCTSEADAKAALYKKFLDNYKGTPEQQRAASETGKEYVSKYGTCPDESDKKIAAFIQNWVTKYDKAVRDFACTDSFDKKDYAKAFEACRVILAAEPENIDTTLLLALAGYLNVASTTPNKALNADAARTARRAIELIESGKAPAKWEKPFTSRDEALGFLNYTLGLVTQETSPADAAPVFIKAAQSNSTFKSQPTTFINLANAYLTSELKKLVDDYTAAFPPNVAIPDEKKAQSDQMLAQIYKVQDRIIDAFARAAALMGTDPKYTASKKDVMARLTSYYKARNPDSTDASVQELINNVLSRPIPIPGQEPVTPPAPVTSSGMNGTNGAAPAGQPASGTVTPTPAAGTAPKPAATPATTTAPASTTPKPKPISKKKTPAARSRGSKTTSGR
ncbi:MAG: hypothetical protein H7Z38_09195 [Rubrivivax sp.]|nr:hypothetical protein [Pyrinomonadaceae bacterium]